MTPRSTMMWVCGVMAVQHSTQNAGRRRCGLYRRQAWLGNFHSVGPQPCPLSRARSQQMANRSGRAAYDSRRGAVIDINVHCGLFLRLSSQ